MPRTRHLLVVGIGAAALILAWSRCRAPRKSVPESSASAPVQASEEAPRVSADSSGDQASGIPQEHSAGVASGREEVRTAMLRGRIESQGGRALPSALVRWIQLQPEDTEETPAWPWADWGVPQRLSLEQRTGSDGTFEFREGMPGGTPFGSTLLVLESGHAPGGLDLPADAAERTGEVRIVLDLSPPVTATVTDPRGQAQPGARVLHAAKPRTPTPGEAPVAHWERFLFQEVQTDESGAARLAPLRGEQAIWAEKDGLASVPWLGQRPTRVSLTLGPAFSLVGHVTMPDLDAWDPTYEGERRILVSGLDGKLWRPLARLRDVGEGEWGPLLVPLAGIARLRVRFEGIPIVPIEEEFEAPPPGSRKRIDFHAEQQADLWFKVQDEAGRPIPTARGLVWWGSFRPTSARRAEGAAKPDGTMYVGGFPPGPVSFEITAPGFAAVEGTHEVPGEGILIDLPRGGRIEGRCLLEGKPVEDFEVVTWQEGRIRIPQSQAFLGRGDGSFALESLAPGDWWLTAADSLHPAGSPVAVRVEPDHTAEVTLELGPAIRGGGRIVDAATGAAVRDARVQPFSSGGMERGLPWGPPIPASADGTFVLDAFVPGSNHVRVQAEGYADSDVTAVLAAGDFLDWGEIRMHRPQSLTVTLLGLEELTRFRPSDVRAKAVEGHVLPETPFSDDGLVRFDGVPPGECKLVLFHPDGDWSRLEKSLEPGKEWRFEYGIAGPRRLAVRLANVPKHVHAPQVFAGYRMQDGTRVTRQTSNQREGLFRFEGLTASSVHVLVFDASANPLGSQQVEFGPELSREIEVSLDEAPFRVRVVNGEGGPLAGAWVTARAVAGDLGYAIDDTDGDGWVSMIGVPAEPVLLDVRHAQAGLWPGIPIDAAIREHEVRFQASAALELRIVDGTQPLAGASVRILAGRSTLSEAKADGQGRARFELLGEGTYRLALQREDCWPATLELTLAAGERAERTAEMRRLADLELSVLSRDGLPVAGLAVDLESLEFAAAVASWLAEERIDAPTGLVTDAQGKLRVRGLPRGPYSWTASLAGETLTGTFELAPGGPPVLVSLSR